MFRAAVPHEVLPKEQAWANPACGSCVLLAGAELGMLFVFHENLMCSEPL